MSPHCARRVTVHIGPGNECRIGINPHWTPTHTLAHLMDALGGACGHQFRGTWFPPCPGHPHPAQVSEADDAGILRCPDTGRVVSRLSPDLHPS